MKIKHKDLVLLLSEDNNTYLLRVEEGKEFHSNKGIIKLDDTIGLEYGDAVVSMADNLIKPLILHGQSNLHPLLALLSILGGVTALGPIGLLVGPMVVAFLQTLLKILQRELNSMEAQGRPRES